MSLTGAGDGDAKGWSIFRDAVLFLGFVLLVALVFVDRPHLFPRSATEINLELDLLPIYALYSFLRMLAGYLLSLLFSIVVGYQAAANRRARRWILPALDILQSVPILAFFPAAVFLFIRLFGGRPAGTECAAVFLICTSQVWNMAFSVYESVSTLPHDLLLAADEFGLRSWARWKRLILPACIPKLTFNSMVSWAAGWYFLIASEIIAVGPASYKLPGLGSYIGQAITSGRTDLMAAGLVTMVLLIIVLHLAVWSPADWWARKYAVDMTVAPTGRDLPPLAVRWLRRSRALHYLSRQIVLPIAALIPRAAAWMAQLGRFPGYRNLARIAVLGVIAVLSYGGYRVAGILLRPLSPQIREIPCALLYSVLRISAAYGIGLLWTIPTAIAVGQNRKLAQWVMPVVQVAAGIPVTAFFPLLVMVTLNHGLSMNEAAILLVLTGMQWYLLFNLIAGVSQIPADLKEVSRSLGLRGRCYWRRVVLPAILPSLVTGSVTAWGGGWNALIISEYVSASGTVHRATGIGALLDHATYVTGDLQEIALAVVSMVLFISVINRMLWRPVYAYVSQKYRMEY